MCCFTCGGLPTEVTEQRRLPDSKLLPHPSPGQILPPAQAGTLLHGDLTKTCSPSSIAPWFPMAGTSQLSRSFGTFRAHIFRFVVSLSHISATSLSLPGPLVSSVFEAMSAHDSHPPQGPLLMAGEGMLWFQ